MGPPKTLVMGMLMCYANRKFMWNVVTYLIHVHIVPSTKCSMHVSGLPLVRKSLRT